MIDLSIILPTYNEERGIEQVIKYFYKTLFHQHINFEIICVENGSTDDTYKLLQKLAKKHKNMYVYQSEKGWGNAVQKGLQQANGKYICYMVSDNQIDPKYILLLYDKMQKEHGKAAKIHRITRENILRLLNSKIYNFLAAFLFDLNTFDINGTPKIIERRLIKNYMFRSQNISFDLELLLKLKQHEISWIEIPVRSKKQPTGFSTTNLRSVFEMLGFMLQFYFSKNYLSNQKIKNKK